VSTPEEAAPEVLKYSENLNPNLRPEDDVADMEPVIMTPGAYASPDPETAGLRMVSLQEADQLQVEISPDFAQEAEAAPQAAATGVDYNSMTVADLKAELDDRGIEYANNASKAELVQLLEEDDATK